MKKLCDWSREDVAHWLVDQGLQQYRDSLGHLDGRGLLSLAQSDFRAAPLSLVTPDGRQQLLERISALRSQPHQSSSSSHANGIANGLNGISSGIANGLNGISNGIANGLNGITNGLGGNLFAVTAMATTKAKAEDNSGSSAVIVVNGNEKEWSGKHNGTPSNGFVHHHKGAPADRIQIRVPDACCAARSAFPEEWSKTGLAVLYALTCFVSTTVMISIVHERVPAKEATPPLPDKFFDWFGRREWAFNICEVIGILLVVAWLVQWALLKYRSIVGRRFFFLVGTLYLYRCVTMYVTTLPVPGMHFRCSPKASGDYVMMMSRVMKMLCGGGLTITGSHHLCGDYLYSGHTVIITLTSLFITEYSPRRLWWYQWLVWALCAVGLFCILLAHDHYSIDVLVAYYVTTRLFWWYHTMANLQVLKESSHSNFVSRVWWYRVFLYLERNVQGIVPRHYQLPLPCKRLLRSTTVKYSRLADSDFP